MSQKYVLMIATAAILIICSVYFVVLTRYIRGMQKWTYSTVVYRFGRKGYRLDATAEISYDNGYNGHTNHPFKMILIYHVNI